MLPLIGLIIVFVSVIGSFGAMGGNIYVLWQPFELVIIAGAAFGAFVIGNTRVVMRLTFNSVKRAFGNPIYDKEAFLELLVMLQRLLKIIRAHGILELEKHIENPFESDIFQAFPMFIANKNNVIFLSDSLRFMMMCGENAEHLAVGMEEDLRSLRRDRARVVAGLNSVNDSLPAIGIVAAVLGVIKTMGAMSEPPAVLGKMIGAALVGTFLGVFLAYGFMGPIARKVSILDAYEIQYYECIKEAILAHASGMAPSVAVEQARKSIVNDVRPTFLELEEAVQRRKST